MKYFSLASVIATLFLTGCSSPKSSTADYLNEAVELNAIEVYSHKPYQASRTRHIDVIDTRLDLRLNWEKQHVIGTALLTIRPYFHSIQRFDLDAKGQEIKSVVLEENGQEMPLEFSYENDVLHIKLDRTFSRLETLKIGIDYVAKPEERKTQTGRAVTSDKGFYFINPLGTDSTKPRQAWTQGETESNSVWFPTIDSPNERCTHQISITVEDGFTTLSNGDLVKSQRNPDGTRTDTWVQNKPIAPYLFMLAISDFAVVNDELNGMKVDYYVDKEYAPYAKEIFKNTPEMISFYSKILGYEYPWSKYSQVAVHDYVSGAMENVSAVIFGDFVQQTHQEMIDGDNEETVAHELFHHWFGDVVTCESWANTPLNESFATYGEYLWFEHKYGKMKADEHLNVDLQNYLFEVKSSGAKDVIRFNYRNADDMFDSHSYAKGGRILHMLRNYVGDEAFFESLKLYLHENEFSSVEIHQLRLAFEQVTGEDLNWFFNQWFMGKGHPELEITYSFDADSLVQNVHVNQVQNTEEYSLFVLPVAIDVYVNGKAERYKVRMDSLEQKFSFKVDAQPDFVNFDADKILVCTKNENRTMAEAAAMYRMGPLYMDKREALEFAIKEVQDTITAKKVLLDAMMDSYAGIREIAVANYDYFDPINDLKLRDVLISTLKNDEKSTVRYQAVIALEDYYSWSEDIVSHYTGQIEADSSLLVISELIRAIAIADSAKGLVYAQRFESSADEDILFAVADVYAAFGGVEKNPFFQNLYSGLEGYSVLQFMDVYQEYLTNVNDVSVQPDGLTIMEKEAQNEMGWFIRYYAVNGLEDLRVTYESRAKSVKKSGDMEISEQYTELVNRIDAFVAGLRETEKDSRVWMDFD